MSLRSMVWSTIEWVASKFGAFFAVFGICLGAIGASGPIVGWMPPLSPLFYALFILIIPIVALPAAAYSVIFLEENFARHRRESKRFGGFAYQEMNHEDLAPALSMFHSQYKDDVSVSIYESAFGKCPDGWKKIVSVRTREIVGYFIVLPLSKAGEKAILDEEFLFSDPSSSSLILSEFLKFRPVYVAMICTIGKPSKNLKAFALKKLAQFLNECKYSTVYARASTGYGLGLIRKHQMIRFDGIDSYELHKTYRKNG